MERPRVRTPGQLLRREGSCTQWVPRLARASGPVNAKYSYKKDVHMSLEGYLREWPGHKAGNPVSLVRWLHQRSCAPERHIMFGRDLKVTAPEPYKQGHTGECRSQATPLAPGEGS